MAGQVAGTTWSTSGSTTELSWERSEVCDISCVQRELIFAPSVPHLILPRGLERPKLSHFLVLGSHEERRTNGERHQVEQSRLPLPTNKAGRKGNQKARAIGEERWGKVSSSSSSSAAAALGSFRCPALKPEQEADQQPGDENVPQAQEGEVK